MYDALNAIATKISGMRASNSDYIRDKVAILEENYRIIAASVVETPSNPINRYVELCSITDNFSTTSLTEKQLYSLNTEANLKKAVSMLNFFKGYRANQNNRELYDKLYFPDVEEGVTDAKGHAKCYLMDCYVKLSGDVTDIFRNPTKYIKDTVSTDKKDTTRRFVILSNEDAKRFGARLHGRTLKEELLKAGVTEKEMSIKTTFKGYRTYGRNDTGEVSSWCDVENREYFGICFEYQYWLRPKADQKYMTVDSGGKWFYYDTSLEYKAPYPGLKNWSPFATGPYNIAYAVVGKTILWEDTGFADQWSVLMLSDDAGGRSNELGAGYCPAYPAMYLIPA